MVEMGSSITSNNADSDSDKRFMTYIIYAITKHVLLGNSQEEFRIIKTKSSLSTIYKY